MPKKKAKKRAKKPAKKKTARKKTAKKKTARKKTAKKKGTKKMAKKKAKKKTKKKTTGRKTKTSKKTRRRPKKNQGSSLEKKIKTALAGGVGAGVGALAGPAVQYATKQTGILGEVIAAAVPLAVGGAIYSKSKKGLVKDFGGGMALMGVTLGLLSGFRRIKSKIPGLEKIDMGPLGQRTPRLYTNATTSQLLIRGNDGILHPIRSTGALGKRKTVVLPNGDRVTGMSLGTAEVDGQKYMPLYQADKGRLQLIKLSGAVARDNAFGACAGGVGGAVPSNQAFGGAVPRNQAFGGAVPRNRAFGQDKARREMPMTTGYRRYSR